MEFTISAGQPFLLRPKSAGSGRFRHILAARVSPFDLESCCGRDGVRPDCSNDGFLVVGIERHGLGKVSGGVCERSSVGG